MPAKSACLPKQQSLLRFDCLRGIIMTALANLKQDLEKLVLSEICPAGEAWMCEVKKGQYFRIVDLEGNQAVDTLFISAHNPEERYSATDTLAMNRQIYLEKGTNLYTNFGNKIATIHDDSCGRHDTLGGACSCESNTVRYSLDKYPMHSCRNNFMIALSQHPIAKKHGLNVRHIGPNIN